MTELSQYRISGGSARELAASVESGVERGLLRPGERLPSVRALAAELDLSPTTVAAAFRELARRGVVVTQPRRGCVVSGAPPLAAPRQLPPLPPGTRDLASGNPDPELLPDLERAAAESSLPLRLYGEEPVVPELEAVLRTELGALGIPADRLCLVSGALDGVERVLDAELRPGDRVAVEDPGYTSTFDLLRALGLVPVPVAIDDAGMLPGELAARLAEGARAVVLTPRGQNPTGAALDARRAAELRAVLAAAPSTLVVEDDHLGRVAGVDSQTTIGATERWAFVRSVAKSLGPDLRLALLAGDPRTVARVEGRLRLGPGWVSGVLQRLVLRLLTDPGVAALLDRAAVLYAERRQALIEALATRGLRGHGRTGLNVWIPVPDEDIAVRALLRAGFSVTPGAIYRVGSPSAVRVTTAALEPGEAEAVAAAVADASAPGRLTRVA
jgi:DNA-binding transcriptional MocR family regulator